MWLSKNTSERNLEIAEILEDMIVPVMAIQSMDEEVLENIKRDNIAPETYYKYQKRFHSMGATTYSDLIIPLPGESNDSHLKGVRKLFDMDVDIIQNHNMRLLPGSEMNSEKIRKKFDFKTKYRLIHGDSGSYKTGNGEEIKSYELEESLRATSTMSEEEVFKLRKIHFLIEFAWNFRIYSDLFKIAKKFKINQLDIILNFLENGKKNDSLIEFWKLFDEASKNEWFNSKEDAEKFFSNEKNFSNLINQEYEKLNIKFSIIILRDYKISFDKVFLQTLKDFNVIPDNFINNVSKIIFSQFPPLNSGNITLKSHIDFRNVFKPDNDYKVNSNILHYDFPKTKVQKQLTDILVKKGTSISKILNTQGFSLRDLKRDFIIDNKIKKNTNQSNHWYWEINNS